MAIRNKLTRNGWLAFVLALSWPAGAQPPSPASRLGLLRAKGVDADITVFPVSLGGRLVPEAGEALALFLERGGMQNIDTSPQAFRCSDEAPIPVAAAQFGDFVRQSRISTAWALYAEVRGAPGAGITEIRGILVEKGGEAVWTYRRTAEDEDFRKQPPREPLSGLVMLVNALREPLGFQDPFRPDAFEGRLAKRYAERTGLPTAGERKAMEKALLDARAKLAGSRLVVFPVLVDGRPDRTQSARLAKALENEKLGQTEVAPALPAFEIDTGPNEQRRLWRMAQAVRAHLRRAPASADYALFTDYTFGPGGKAFTVHFIICEGKGEWVIVDFQNDHHPDFNSVELKSADDCDRLVLKRLAGFLRKASAR